MEPIESFKSFGFISIFITWLIAWYMVAREPTDKWNKAKSVSMHAAAHKKKIYIVYAGILTVMGVLFYLFCLFWFIPIFHLSRVFATIATIALVFELLLVWIPEAGKFEKIHEACGFGLSFCLMLLLIFLFPSPYVSFIAKGISMLAIIWMLIVWYLFLFVKKSASYHLIYQATYVFGLHMSFLAATYIK